MTHTVAVRPSDVEIEVRDGEDLFSAAQRLGYRWPTVCGGKGTCRTCFVQVEEGGGSDEVEGDHGAMHASIGVDAPDDRRAAPERHDGDAARNAETEHGGDLVVVGG